MLSLEEMKAREALGFISKTDFLNGCIKDVSRETMQIVHKTEYNDRLHRMEVREYYNIPAAFDIETTADDDKKAAFMYIWQLNINGYNVYGRTWEEFAIMLAKIAKIYKLDYSRRMVIYIHNLGYESSYLLPRFFHTFGMFATGKHEPLKYGIVEGFEFRDSARLSGLSLAKTADTMTMFNDKKMSGDLDYTKKRNSKTPLTEKELGYCLNDVRTLSEYIYEQITQYDDILQIPMTNTGRVRIYTRQECLYKQNKNGKTVANHDFKKTMKELTIQPEEYDCLKRAYWGGYTHASNLNVGSILKKVHSMDFTSSYPAVMVSEKYPMSAGEQVTYKTWADYQSDIDAGYLIIGTYLIENLDDSKFPYEHYISRANCMYVEDALEDNGRIVRASKIMIECTNIDFDIIRNHYNGTARILSAWRYKAGYLPKEFIESILHLYQAKTELKGVKGKEAEYQLKKGMINSEYGMSGTDIVKGEVTFNKRDGWKVETADLISALERYNKDRKKIVFFPWACYITAYARRNLWTGIDELKEDYIYSDTDSVKFQHYDKHSAYFESYNKQIQAKIKAMCKEYGIDEALTAPKTVKGVSKPLGVWDYEGYYQKFKTLGAKRYMYTQHGKYHITIAGVNKKTACKYIAKIQQEKPPFDFFDYGMTIPKGYSGKMAARYYMEDVEAVITDEYGNTETMKEKGGCYLYETDYCMTQGRKYAEYLESLTADNKDIERGIASIKSRLEHRKAVAKWKAERYNK